MFNSLHSLALKIYLFFLYCYKLKNRKKIVNSANRYSLKNQPINLILFLVTVFFLKLIKDEGYKSQAFRTLCMIILVLTLIGLLALSIQTSIDSTNKFSFKGAGTVYRSRYTKLKNCLVSNCDFFL